MSIKYCTILDKHMNIIENIENIMKTKGITAYKLEKDNILNQTTFSSWRKGKDPAVSKIEKIMQYLDVTPNEIFGYNENEAAAPAQEVTLTENEKELLKYFRQLPDREQLKMIGRVEDKAAQFQESKQEYINSEVS